MSDARRLTLLDCVGIGVNGIIGMGIFLLPAAVFRHAGGRSPLAWLLCGALCFLVGLCFAEASSTTARSGGPYAYATAAFGSEIGYGVGFVALASTVLGYATVTRGFAESLAYFVPAIAGREAWVGTAIIALLALMNLAGLKPAAWTSDFFSVAKLLPLLAFVVVGAFYMDPARLHAPPAPHPGESTGLVAAALAGLFACTGFEFVSVPAGETRRPERAIPLALLGSLVGSIALYAAVQAVAVGLMPDLGEANPALARTAEHAFGFNTGRALAIGALISSFGFCTGSALVGPSYLAAFAADGMAPRGLAVRRENGSPIFAVLVFGGTAALLGTLGDFNRLADIANIAAVLQYVATCASVPMLRRKGIQAGFRLPGGPLIPLAALAGCAVFLREVKRDEAIVCAEVLAVGFVLRVGLVLARRLRAFRV